MNTSHVANLNNNKTVLAIGIYLTWIGVGQQRTYGEQNVGHSKSRTPILLQDVKADLTIVVYIAMVNACSEHNLRNEKLPFNILITQNRTIKIPPFTTLLSNHTLHTSPFTFPFRIHNSPPKLNQT